MAKYLDRVLRNPEAFGISKCTLCLRRPRFIGIFTPKPETHEKFGGKPGRGRAIIYGLCARCMEREDRDIRVEARFLESLAKEANKQ